MKLLKALSLRTVSKITHFLMLGLMAVNLLVLVFLPTIIQQVINLDIGSGYLRLSFDKPLYRYFLVILYISGALAFMVLNDLRMIFKSCVKEEVFVEANIARLFRMSMEVLIITIVFITKMFVVNSLMTMIIVFVFFLATVFCLVLTLLFEQAIHYKLDVDLTI